MEQRGGGGGGGGDGVIAYAKQGDTFGDRYSMGAENYNQLNQLSTLCESQVVLKDQRGELNWVRSRFTGGGVGEGNRVWGRRRAGVVGGWGSVIDVYWRS